MARKGSLGNHADPPTPRPSGGVECALDGKPWGMKGWRRMGMKGRVIVLAFFLALAAPFAGAEAPAFTAGRFLVAGPSMPDPRFAETVIYMCAHDEKGALGLILNRPAGKMPLKEFLKALKIDPGDAEGEVAIRLGGPVELQSGFVLHSDDFEGTQPLCRRDGIAVTRERDVLEAMAEGRGPARTLLFFGYAGWGAGQLEGEMRRRDWVVVPADQKIMFGEPGRAMWKRAIASHGVDL